MITACPYCGHHLPQVLLDGMSSCINCRRAFDSSNKNLLLSTAWVVRKQNISDPEILVNKFDLSLEDAKFVIEFVDEKCYPHEEFQKLISFRKSA